MTPAEEAPAGEDLTAAEQAKDDKSLEESGLDDDSLVIERRSSGKLAGPSQARQPVWEDPEDEAVEVDIAAINRLRKLRASEAETLLTGKTCRLCEVTRIFSAMAINRITTKSGLGKL